MCSDGRNGWWYGQGMAAQRLGVVPEAQAARLAAALRNTKTADQELHDAVRAALQAGGSVREVARLTGMSTNTIARWGKDREQP